MWAAKRKFFIFLTFILIVLGIAFYFYKTVIEKKPTCFDGIQNNLEEGIDCGGSCEQVCKLKAAKANVIWAKTFEVIGGVSNIAALVENPNFDYKMLATYVIKIFNIDGVETQEFKNNITLFPGEKRIIFIPSVKTGKIKITKTLIDFDSIRSLTLAEERKNNLLVTSKVINKDEYQTRLTVGIKNPGLSPERNIEVIAVLYNENGNVINIAKTFIEYIDKRDEKKIELTWQKNFDSENIRIDVYLRKI